MKKYEAIPWIKKVPIGSVVYGDVILDPITSSWSWVIEVLEEDDKGIHLELRTLTPISFYNDYYFKFNELVYILGVEYVWEDE